MNEVLNLRLFTVESRSEGCSLAGNRRCMLGKCFKWPPYWKMRNPGAKVAGNMADGGIFVFDCCFSHRLRTSRLVLFILSQFTCLCYLYGLRVLLFCLFCHVLGTTRLK